MKTRNRWVKQKKNPVIHSGVPAAPCRLEASALFNSAMRQVESRQQAIRILIDQSMVSFSADAVGVYDLKGDSLVYNTGKGLTIEPPVLLPMNSSNVLGKSLYLGRILQFNPAQPLDENCSFCRALNQQGFQYLLVTPLRTSQKNVGVVYIACRHPDHLQPDQEQLLNAYTEAAGNTLHRFFIKDQLEQTETNRDLEQVLYYDLMEIAGETTDMEPLLHNSLTRILKAADCAAGLIHFIGPADQRLIIAVSEHISDEFKNYLIMSGLSEQLWTRVYREQDVIQVHNIPDRSLPEIPNPERQYYTYLGVPIRIKGKTIGVLSLLSQSDRILEQGIEQMVTSAAKVLGLAVENSQYRKQAEDAVILKERQRLGRNLHDSVSQSLYALVISADVSEKLLRIKDYPGLRLQLQDLGKVALQGLKEMRLMLYEFRPTSLEPGGLVRALENRLKTVERRAGIDATFSAVGNIDLPPQLEQEIYQIAIEGLNNSLKHAEASVITVSLRKEAENITLEIRDNGLGFDPSTPRTTVGMGLDSMRERAHILGGELFVTSVPGNGTSVRLEAPLARASSIKE
jgi:signal transduction histidine kinase